MAKTIDSFLVSLGFDLDEKSKKGALQGLDDVKSGALKMGAALAGAFSAAGGYAALRTAESIERISNAADKIPGVSTNFLDQLGFAIDRAGGEATEALPLLESLQDTLFNFKNLGKGFEPFVELEKLKINSKFLADSENSVEFLERLILAIDKIEDRGTQVGALKALGISSGAQDLILKGPQAFEEYIQRAAELSQISEGLEKSSHELRQAWDDASRAQGDMLRDFTEIVGPTIQSWLNKWTDTLGLVAQKTDELADRFGGKGNLLTPENFFSPEAFRTRFEILNESGAGKFIPNIGPLFRIFGGGGEPDAGVNPTSGIVPPLAPTSSINTTNNSNRVDKLEVNINEASNPDEAARRVIQEVNKIFGVTEQSLRTSDAG